MFGLLRRSLAAKLAAGYLLAVVGVTTVVGLLLLRQLASHATAQFETALVTHAQLMAQALPAAAVRLHDRPALQALVSAWARPADGRVTLIAPDGTVVADSGVPEADLPAVENHRDRPEVLAALAGRAAHALRTSATVRQPLFYVAVPIRREGTTAGVLRLALPVTQVHALLGTVGRTLGVGLGVTAALIVLVSLCIAWRITRPLGAIARSARAVADGALDTRVRVQGLDEVAQLGQAFNTMAGRLAVKIQELEASRSQIEGILHGMAEGVLAVGPDERLLLMNPAARAIGGISPTLGPGTPLVEAIRDPQLQSLVRTVLASGSPSTQDVTLYAPAERHLTVRVTTCACPPADGAWRGLHSPRPPAGRCALLVLHDVTEHRRLEQVRRDFVANVSHELKTPLTAIQGAVETLLDGALGDPAHARPFVASIAEEAARLRRLVEDLLTLAQVETRAATPAREPIPLGAFLEEEIARHRTLADAHQVSLALKGPAARLSVTADRRQLSQAVGNLLDNAIKYNHPGGRVVVRASEQGDRLRLDVEDTGVGIPPDDLPRIFERFYRVDKGRSRETGGTGLGLSIVKHVAEAHGGAVTVESRLGRGSCFTLTLPLA